MGKHVIKDASFDNLTDRDHQIMNRA